MDKLTYLGDSVYVEQHTYGFTIFLNNGERTFDDQIVQKNAIFMEPEVAEALAKLIKERS